MNDEEESEEISDATLERNDTMEMEEDGDEVSVSSKSSKSSEVSEVEQSSLAMISRYQVVQDHSFDEIQLPTATAEQIRLCWAAFFAKMPSREAAGEAIYDVLMEEAPGVAALFKSARSVFGLRFIEGLNSLVVEINEPAALKKQVETLGYQHLDYDVTTARVELVRDGILQVMEQEMGAQFTSFYRDSFSALLNYVGGAFMYIKRELAGHIKIIQRSWRLARKVMEEEAVHQQEEPDSPLSVPQVPSAPSEAATDEKVKAKEAKEETEEEKGAKDKNSLQVPTSFEGMFLFNAAVMGYGESSWMKIVLDHLDAIAVNVANTSRLQEECFVLTIHLSKVKDSVNLPEFKAVMLAALRSIVPDEWNMDHEMAWNWLWESVERIISSTISFPRAYEKTIRTFLFEQSEANMNQLRAQTYSCFFQRCPSGQDHFKQSTTRLYFILDRNYEMVLEIFENPAKVVEDLSALGLRHVGFGVPVEFFPPFVASAVEALNTLTTDEAISQAFTWSETLISKILMRVILEGSTIVMKAINLNEEAALRKAISVAPRGQRAQQLLNITAGTQSFSPLFWAIDSGSLNSAKAIIQDLLTIRADREVYYYGCEELFRRHPNIIKRLCTSAPTLLETLLDGLIWRSRVTSEGLRRVNYYIKHLIQDEEGNFAPAMDDVVQHADPKIASHPCMILATDMVWFKFATFYFLLSRGYFLFTLLVFASGQTILVRHQEMETQEETRRWNHHPSDGRVDRPFTASLEPSQTRRLWGSGETAGPGVVVPGGSVDRHQWQCHGVQGID
ncbi:unnamed protein product [Durusdinium trenchii]|uniref:Globin domain-containing protein n=1 Tax=Durusdinium trenchii TaxID=1381693 RepID=A0ABP0SD11_9DINO